ncbi:MAG: HNH endonuclease signature motif containing protein, partial [Mycobacterium sp.]
MLANQVSDREAVLAAFDAYDAACEHLAALDFIRLTPAELFDLQSRREHRDRTTAVADHRILAALQAQATPKDIGARTWTQILCTRLR